MPVSPADFALWARATGNRYPQTTQEKFDAAPHAYEFVKNVGKAASSAPGGRVGGTIMYDQPVSVQNSAPNSLFNSPVTPDNAAPKVAGTLDSTLTSEHFQNQEEENAAERRQQNSLLSTVGKVALGAGAVAAGYALTQAPGGQQALSNAGTFAKENARNIGERTSSFLRGLGGGRYVDADVIVNSGDVTPPTTAQRYNQDRVNVATQEIQAAKGAPAGDERKLYLPPTSESYSPKPVTETESLASSQTSGPRPSRSDVIASVLEKNPLSTQQRGAGGRFMPIPVDEEYAPTVVDPRTTQGKSFEFATKYASPEVRAARLADLHGEPNPSLNAPLVDPLSGEIRNPEISVPGYSEAFPSVGQRVESFLSAPTKTVGVSEQTAALDPSFATPETTSGKVERFLKTHGAPLYGVEPSTEAIHFPTTVLTARSGAALDPVRHQERPFSLTGKGNLFVKNGPSGEKESVEVPYTQQQEQPITFKSRSPLTQRLLGEGETYASDPTRSYPVQRIAGARDVEAALATLEATGVNPEGPYSSLATGERYNPAWGAASGIDPRVVTRGGSVDPGNTDVSFAPAPLSAASKKAWDLYGVTQDPGVLNAASSNSIPINITLPGGEQVPTKSFFRPFKAVEAFPGSDLTQVENLENLLLGAQTVHSNTKAGVLARAGLPATTQLRAADFAALPDADKNALSRSYGDLQNAQNALQASKENQYVYSIPEELQLGTKLSPSINQLTGELVGMVQVPENKALTPLELLNIRRASSIGSKQVGGVGRGESSRTPSRLLGEGGRGYSGINYSQIDPESFGENAVMLKALEPERITPEGLLYSDEAMEPAGGGSHRGLGTRFREVYGPLPAPTKGALRIAAAEQARRQIEATAVPGSYATYSTDEKADPATKQWRQNILKSTSQGTLNLDQMRQVMDSKQAAPQTVYTVQETQPRQLTIPGAGLSPQVTVHPEARRNFDLNTDKMRAQVTGRSLQSALKAALERANPPQQLALF
jgi:hypothetical protein